MVLILMLLQTQNLVIIITISKLLLNSRFIKSAIFLLISVAIIQQSAILNMLKRCELKLKHIISYRKDVF